MSYRQPDRGQTLPCCSECLKNTQLTRVRALNQSPTRHNVGQHQTLNKCEEPAISPATVMANVLAAPQTPSMGMDERLHHLFGRIPGARVHLYGKGECPGRKAGNVDIVGGDAVSSACLRRSASFPAGV